jgi:hypothetical protein
MDAESILRPKRVKRKKRKRFTTAPPTYDLRPLILEMKRIAPQQIFMRLTTQEGATGRPDEVLNEMGFSVDAARVERKALNLK